MSLSTQIMDEIKAAMRAKDTVEFLRDWNLAQTATGSKKKTSADEIKLLQKLVKPESVLNFYYKKTVWI
jgi:uncharacterized protein YqeY